MFPLDKSHEENWKAMAPGSDFPLESGISIIQPFQPVSGFPGVLRHGGISDV
jgi:hypothetical protein